MSLTSAHAYIVRSQDGDRDAIMAALPELGTAAWLWHTYELLSVSAVHEMAEVVRQRVAVTQSQVHALVFQRASNESQSALLKILEEPVPRITWVLVVLPELPLLLTITSRCQVIRVDESLDPELVAFAEQFTAATVSERLQMLTPILESAKDKIEIPKTWLLSRVRACLTYYHHRRAYEQVRACQNVMSWLQSPSPSLKMIGEYLVLVLH